jgi:hypothetical protein
MRRKGMRKFVVLFIVLAILPVVVFAQFSVGPALYLKSPVLLGDVINADISNVNQFSGGALVRFQAGIFQTEGLLLLSLGEVNSLNLFLDAGVILDVDPLFITFGAGPHLTNNIGNSPIFQAGLNAKLGADIHVGPVTVGLSYIMALNIDSGIKIYTRYGLLGAHALFDL